MRPLDGRWRCPRSARSGGEFWPRRHAVGRWPHRCADRPHRTAAGKMSLLRSLRLCLVVRPGSCQLSALGSGPLLPSLQVSRAPGTLPSPPLAAFGSISPFSPPRCLLAVHRPCAAFPLTLWARLS